MPRRRTEEFAATTQWRVLTLETDDGEWGSCSTERDQAHAHERYAWLIQARPDLVVILQARAAEGDDWITIERHP